MQGIFSVLQRCTRANRYLETIKTSAMELFYENSSLKPLTIIENKLRQRFSIGFLIHLWKAKHLCNKVSFKHIWQVTYATWKVAVHEWVTGECHLEGSCSWTGFCQLTYGKKKNLKILRRWNLTLSSLEPTLRKNTWMRTTSVTVMVIFLKVTIWR